MQPYRNDVEALAARHAALEAEVAEKTRARDEAARMLAEAQARERADAIAADFAAGGPGRRRNATVAAGIGAIAIAVIGFAVARARRPDERTLRTAAVMAQFEVFADRICGCRDKACVEKVSDEMARWGTEVARTMDSEKPDEETTRKAQTIAERMSKCMIDKYQATERTDVPAEAPPALAPNRDETQQGVLER